MKYVIKEQQPLMTEDVIELTLSMNSAGTPEIWARNLTTGKSDCSVLCYNKNEIIFYPNNCRYVGLKPRVLMGKNKPEIHV